eukprot:6643108-Prorocentrum_lima.AAC.1
MGRRVSAITNKQLFIDRDAWLSSLSQAALEGTEKQQFIAQRSLWRALELPAPRPLPSLLAEDGATILSPQLHLERWTQH